jgi:hypothetical protein
MAFRCREKSWHIHHFEAQFYGTSVKLQDWNSSSRPNQVHAKQRNGAPDEGKGDQ